MLSIKLFDRDETKSKNYLISATAKRYFRLFIPVFGSCFLAYILLSFGAMYNIQLSNVFGKGFADGWLAWFYNFNPSFIEMITESSWRTFFNFHVSPTYNQVLWTINPEFFGSMICFSLFAIFSKVQWRFIVYLLLSIASVFAEKYWLVTFILGFMICDYDFTVRINSPQSKFVRAISFIDERVINNIPMSLLILFSFILIGGWKNTEGGINTVLAFQITYLALRSTFIQKIFSLPLFRWLGKISFSLYLIHLPIICSLTCFLYLILPFSHYGNVTVSVIVSTVVILFLSQLFEKYVDRFAINFSNKIGKYFLTKWRLVVAS